MAQHQHPLLQLTPVRTAKVHIDDVSLGFFFVFLFLGSYILARPCLYIAYSLFSGISAIIITLYNLTVLYVTCRHLVTLLSFFMI